MNNENSTEEAKQKAQEQMMALSKAIEKEAYIENLIKAKGFDDVIVYLDEGIANIILLRVLFHLQR